MADNSDKAYQSIELHYWLQGTSHNMDAFVQNRCEYEFLNLINEIAKSFNAEITVETEPLIEGGLKRIYKVISKTEGKKALITTAVVTAIATAVIVTPITSTINKVIDVAIERVFENKDSKKLLDEKTRLEIEKLKQEIKIDSMRLIDNNRIKSNRSNFYLQLMSYSGIEKVSFVLEDEEQNRIIEEEVVERERFIEFESVEEIRFIPEFRAIREIQYETEKPVSKIENAVIEIISPDFSIKSNKWKGSYDGKTINFKISATEFNELVQSGKIQFKKGATITCQLIETRVGRKVNYEVLTVSKY